MSSIEFSCLNCGKQYRVQSELGGKSCTCKCGQRMAIPYPVPHHPPSPAVNHWTETTAPPPSAKEQFAFAEDKDEDEEDEYDRYEKPTYSRSKRSDLGSANRIVAGIGAAMLLLGLFLPMLHGPFGLWLSFIDLPWKAINVGLNVAAADDDEGKGVRDNKLARRREPENKTPITVLAAAAASIIYPLGIFSIVGLSFLLICSGTKRNSFFMLGAAALLSTIVYGLVFLGLSTQKNIGLKMALTSPGFGWAVIFIGGLALTGAGLIRSERR